VASGLNSSERVTRTAMLIKKLNYSKKRRGTRLFILLMIQMLLLAKVRSPKKFSMNTPSRLMRFL